MRMLQTFLAAVAAYCLVPLSASSLYAAPIAPPLLNATNQASHHAFGFAIGVRFRERIAQAMIANTAFSTHLLPFYLTSQGRTLVDGWVSAARREFPHLMEELEGMAAGAGRPAHELTLINLADEIMGFLNANNSPQTDAARDHCSDIYYIDSDTHRKGHLLGHNEDAVAYVKETAYLVRGSVSHSPTNFLYYSYPGVLPGNAFGFNAHGLVFSCNAVFPKKVIAGAVPRNFLTRAAVDARSLGELRALLKHVNLASGFSLNVGDIHTGELSNFEVHGTDWIETPQTSKNYSHFNMYEYLSVAQHTDESTLHRLARYDELPPARDWASIRNILGDTNDPIYPIYRDGAAPDCCATVATGAFDLGSNTFSLFVENPKLHPTPILQLSLIL